MHAPLESLASALRVQDSAPATSPAAPAASPVGGLVNLLVPMAVIIGIFYFVLILPEKKKQKQRSAMLDAMKKGDRVVTTSGIHGQVAMVQDDVVTLQVDEGVRLRFSKAAIQTILTTDAPTEKLAEKKA